MFWFLRFQGMRVQGWGLGVSMRQEGSADQVWCVCFQDIPRPSNVVPFWVWYGFLVRILIRTTQKGTTLEGLGCC